MFVNFDNENITRFLLLKKNFFVRLLTIFNLLANLYAT